MAGRNTSRVTLALGLAVGITVFLGVTIGSVLGRLGVDGGSPVAVSSPATVLGVSVTQPAKELPTTETTVAQTIPPTTTTTTTTTSTSTTTVGITVVTTTTVAVESTAAGPQLFVTGPATVPAGSVAEFCLSGSPEPLGYAAVTIDGQPLGGMGEGGCVTGWVAEGEHLVEATGDVAGVTVTGTLTITGV